MADEGEKITDTATQLERLARKLGIDVDSTTTLKEYNRLSPTNNKEMEHLAISSQAHDGPYVLVLVDVQCRQAYF